ncbi:unnamed protein product [Adineta steineri]|uniref:DUF6570 domain-containing protein n=1 Tax=Adineta steineri TaxID=433720 RepID=A0A816AT61_9BILA|nr:unnamed protein product [Adineta steineri]CAF1598933.1 unnamed protein product [Adineta steineri]
MSCTINLTSYICAENNTFEVIDANDRAVLQFEAKISSNRVAAWRAKRNAKESEASRLIRLDKESDARTAKRRKRNRLTTITKDYSSSKDNAANKKNETGNYEKNKLVKKPINKLDNQSRQINKLQKVRSLEEIGKKHQATLYYEVYEKVANGGSDCQRENKDILRRVRSLIESTTKFKSNSNYEAFTMSIQQCNQNLEKVEDSRLTRSVKRRYSETKDEKITQKLQKRNHGQFKRKMEIPSPSEQIWPKIATTETKHHCLVEFKEAMSNDIVDRTICMICACLHYRLNSIERNIGKIPNQHLLYPTNEMPSCVIKLNIDIDPNTEHVEISEEVRNCLMHAKDSSVIINKMLLCRKAINVETGCGIICNKCHKYLISNKIPPFALNNLMWIGDVPEELQDLTLSEQKLIALYRHSSCVNELFSISRDPSSAQTALKGTVITFPQNVSEIAKSLPLSSDQLSEFIKIIFVGRSLPKKDQLRSILTVRREIIRKALV